MTVIHLDDVTVKISNCKKKGRGGGEGEADFHCYVISGYSSPLNSIILSKNTKDRFAP